LGSISGDQGNAWKTATVDLSAYSSSVVQLRFSGLTGTSYTSDICIDNVNVSTAVTTLNYCTPAPTNGTSDGDYVGGVALGSISNLNSGSNGGPSYQDYTAQSTSLNRTGAFNLTVVEGGYAPDRYAAWIDYNQDGDFTDAGEKLGEFTGSSAGTSHTINFTVPGSAALGATRMRVRCLYNGNANGVDPCADGDYGETEDYTVNITVSTSSLALNIDQNNPVWEANFYPNPTSDLVTVDLNVAEMEAARITMMVYDVLGKSVIQETYQLESGQHYKKVDLSAFEAGVYTFVLQLNDERQTARIILR